METKNLKFMHVETVHEQNNLCQIKWCKKNYIIHDTIAWYRVKQVPFYVFRLKSKHAFIDYLESLMTMKNQSHILNILSMLWHDVDNSDIFYFPKYLKSNKMQEITNIYEQSVIPKIFHAMIHDKRYPAEIPLEELLAFSPSQELRNIVCVKSCQDGKKVLIERGPCQFFSK